MLRLGEQDRSSWDAALIAEADRLSWPRCGRGRRGASRCRPRSRRCTPQAPTYEETDWPQLLVLYDALLGVWPSPVVALNRAVVVAMVAARRRRWRRSRRWSATAGCAGYRYLPATKADLLRRLGRHEEAGEAYRAALALTENETERAFLTERLSRRSEGLR